MRVAAIRELDSLQRQFPFRCVQHTLVRVGRGAAGVRWPDRPLPGAFGDLGSSHARSAASGYALGGLSIVSQPLRVVVPGTESWLAFARWAIGRSVRTRLPRMVFQVSRALALEDDERRPLAAGSSRSQPSTLTGQSSRTEAHSAPPCDGDVAAGWAEDVRDLTSGSRSPLACICRLVWLKPAIGPLVRAEQFRGDTLAGSGQCAVDLGASVLGVRRPGVDILRRDLHASRGGLREHLAAGRRHRSPLDGDVVRLPSRRTSHREDDAFDLDDGVGQRYPTLGDVPARGSSRNKLRLERPLQRAPVRHHDDLAEIGLGIGTGGACCPATKPRCNPHCALDHRDWVESNDPQCNQRSGSSADERAPGGICDRVGLNVDCLILLLDDDPANRFALAGTEERPGASGNAAKRKEHRPDNGGPTHG